MYPSVLYHETEEDGGLDSAYHSVQQLHCPIKLYTFYMIVYDDREGFVTLSWSRAIIL